MIIKASQRSGGKNLAAHLMNSRENDHIELHEIRGLAATDLHDAFEEITAQAKTTKCKQPLFSTSINPPEGKTATIPDFEAAIERIEKKNGLEGQPRAVVFHEKEGRRHCHVVWSRIDTERNRAINLPHFKAKLNDISRDLYREHGWKLPDGFKKNREASRENYTLSEWQQAKRNGLDPQAFKTFLRSVLERSDSRAGFEAALQERGFYLARGDKRGFVVLDQAGEVYSLSRYSGEKKKALSAKLGAIEHLPTVDQLKLMLEHRRGAQQDKKLEEQKAHHETERQGFRDKLETLRERQRTERRELVRRQRERERREEMKRANRLRTGVRGFFQRITGKAGSIERQNAKEREQCRRRDLAERQGVIEGHLQARQEFKRGYDAVIDRQTRARDTLQRNQTQAEIDRTRRSSDIKRAWEAIKEADKARDKAQEAERNAGRGRERGFEP